MTFSEFVNTINNLRLSSKKNWYVWSGEVNGVPISLKGFGTWIQRLETPVFTDGSPMDLSVDAFKKYLFEVVDPFDN